MPVGVLGDERPQLPQIIARERAALDPDRFHRPDVLHAGQPSPALNVQTPGAGLQPAALKRRAIAMVSLRDKASSEFETGCCSENRMMDPGAKAKILRPALRLGANLLCTGICG